MLIITLRTGSYNFINFYVLQQFSIKIHLNWSLY